MNPISQLTDFSAENIKAEGDKNDIFKVLKQKIFQPRAFCLEKS